MVFNKVGEVKGDRMGKIFNLNNIFNYIIFFSTVGLSFFIACGNSNETTLLNECVVTNCHGADVTCGIGEPSICTEEYVIGDQCRSYATCEINNGSCEIKKESKYDRCINCIAECQKLPINDAFSCDEQCRQELQ